MNTNQKNETTLSQIAGAMADFTGAVAATYKTNSDRSKEQYHAACAEAQALQAKQAEDNYLDMVYPCIGNLLMDAINDTAAVTALLPINSLDKLYCAQRTKKLEDGTAYLVYRGWIRIGVPVSAQKLIQATLQKQVTELANQNGFPALDVVVKLCPYNEVFYLVRFRGAKQGAKK